MKIIVILYSSLLFVTTIDSSEVIENALANDNEFPYMASLKMHYYGSIEFEIFSECAGVIIDKNWILTSAECLYLKRFIREYKPSEIKVYVGSNIFGNGKEYAVSKTVIHPDFDKSISNNIALIKLNTDLQFDYSINSISLSNEYASDSLILPEDCIKKIIDWTIVYENGNEMRKMDYVRAKIETCLNFTEKDNQITSKINEDRNLICASTTYNKEKYTGGNPLISNGYLSGILTGSSMSSYQKFPPGFIKVSQYLSWIKKTIRQ